MTITADGVFHKLLDRAEYKFENTCDGLIAGDGGKTVNKIGVCFKLTAQLICEAQREGCDMVITHEPPFTLSDRRENANIIDLKKWELLDKSGIALYRFHDHAHNTVPDYIHAGFIRDIGLKIEKSYERENLGVCRYELADSPTVRELAVRIEKNLGVEFVRVVGDADVNVKSVCLGLGSVGFEQINKLIEPGCDLFITGEVGEICVDEYIRDACFFGKKKAIIILGHYSSEYAGMRYLTEKINETIAPAVYLDSGEVYRRIHSEK